MRSKRQRERKGKQIELVIPMHLPSPPLYKGSGATELQRKDCKKKIIAYYSIISRSALRAAPSSEGADLTVSLKWISPSP